MNKRLGNPSWSWRSRAVGAFLLLLGLSLGIRAIHLQVFDKGFLHGQAQDRYMRVLEIPSHRGMILDRHGETLAASTPVDSIWVNPAPFLAHPGSVERLAAALRMPPSRLREKLKGRERREFVYVQRHLPPHEARKILALKLPGLYAQREYRRYYPTSEISGQLLGFTNIDDRGLEGLELSYDSWLAGQPGSRRVMIDAGKKVIDDLGAIREARPGRDLQLSIDRRIQYLAYRELKAAVVANKAKAGTMVVLDPRTGEILAMVNQPAFNPNNREGISPGMTRNRAVTDLFEPGSTLKPFIVATALEQALLQPTSVIDTSPGWFTVQGNTIRDLHNYGVLDLGGILAKSSNVGASRIALAIPTDRIWSALRDYGFGEMTASGFPGERGGTLRHFQDWRPIDHATVAYGYGLSTTALQLASAYAVIANGGERRPVSFFTAKQLPPAHRVISTTTAVEVGRMLERVVREGTATAAAIPGYRVAGKTGTARKSGIGGYAERRYQAVFAGYVPASRPRLVAVVVIDEPSAGAYYGGAVAAPVFSRVMAGALRLMEIPPDDLPDGAGLVHSAGSAEELG
ncbi:MAG TPA: penicillin-binding transpeptidase domain-containing protein [Candidatus Acidoferrales bacterium]|nr:penicillin-binding transpeptidase domain-containing protein [Candidatus Acidoferrales bacterium]